MSTTTELNKSYSNQLDGITSPMIGQKPHKVTGTSRYIRKIMMILPRGKVYDRLLKING